MRHRIQFAVRGNITLRSWKPTLSLIHAPHPNQKQFRTSSRNQSVFSTIVTVMAKFLYIQPIWYLIVITRLLSTNKIRGHFSEGFTQWVI